MLNDLNGDGLANDGGVGVAGATVALFRDVNSNGVFDSGTDTQVGASVTTPASGAYSFASLATGVYFVNETNPAGFVSTAAIAGTGTGTTSLVQTNDRIRVTISTAGSTSSGNDPDQVEVRALTIEKSSIDISYDAVGDVLSYRYEVTNTGNVTISAISVSDDNVDAAPVCDVTTLAPGEFATCTASHTVTQADLDAGTVTNNASATGTPSGGTLVDPTDTATATADQNPALTLDKTITAGDPYSTVGATIDYQYIVTNTGNVTISAISVSDDNVDAAPVCDVTTLEPGEFATCTASHTVTQADLDAGTVTNNASATAPRAAARWSIRPTRPRLPPTRTRP